ncbi:MAG TPA: HEAT repeat domain-containing protein [Pirellulales bacterium]|jgi:HEAT repeat protein
MPGEIDTLKQSLVSSDAVQQGAAAEKLAQMGEDAQPAAVELIGACAGSEALREWATAALEAMGPPAVADVQKLITLLDAKSADVGYWAATLLGRLGPDGAAATAALAKTLGKSPHAQVRERAALALGKIGPAAASAAPALQEAASSGSPRLASLARDALSSVMK